MATRTWTAIIEHNNTRTLVAETERDLKADQLAAAVQAAKKALTDSPALGSLMVVVYRTGINGRITENARRVVTRGGRGFYVQ